jgi:hypothetical protein
VTDWISRHGHSRQIIFIDIGNLFQWNRNPGGATDVDNLLTTFTGIHIFSFRGRESDGVLTVWFPADRSSIKHEDKTGMRTEGIIVTGRVHPTPEDIVLIGWMLFGNHTGRLGTGEARTQIGMFRPIRMDHTNCLQVAIKTIQFNWRSLIVWSPGVIFHYWIKNFCSLCYVCTRQYRCLFSVDSPCISRPRWSVEGVERVSWKEEKVLFCFRVNLLFDSV